LIKYAANLADKSVNNSVEADFDRLALLDEEGWTTNNHYHDFLLRHVPRNCDNALEIGCGTGAFARQLGMRCGRVVGLDLSAEMIRVARSRSTQFDNVEFLNADAMTATFPAQHFDFVCSIATFHHLQQRELLLKIKEAVRQGGVLMILDLVQSETLIECVPDVVALGMIHNGRLQPPAAVRKAWEEHGKHDSYSTLNDIRALADEILPGAIVRRHLFWRYSLLYQK
jgi:ubiquinone/menaquinone biosynthesis C-methylase UbiE